MVSASQPLTVKCPQCQRLVAWSSENTYRPFCCERCKLIDLGEWAAEEKVIPGESIPTEFDDHDENPFFQ